MKATKLTTEKGHGYNEGAFTQTCFVHSQNSDRVLQIKRYQLTQQTSQNHTRTALLSSMASDVWWGNVQNAQISHKS